MKYFTLAALAIIIVVNTTNAQSIATPSTQSTPSWGIGLRLGDPSGITVKKYLSKHAIELNVGRTHMWNNRGGWYDDRFNKWYDGKHYGYSEYQYSGYKASAPISMQLHFLFQNPIRLKSGQETGELDWYCGLGGQFRTQSYYYHYKYKIDGDNGWNEASGERVTNIDLGVDGVLGLEYRFKKAPFSIFTDANVFMEVVDDPFVFDLQGGLGVRYNF